MSRRPAETTCSFCGRPAEEAGPLVTGPGVRICEQCVGRCRGLLAGRRDEGEEEQRTHALKVPAPHTIKERLDRDVVGHERAKRILSVAVHNHYKRVKQELTGGAPNPEYADVAIEKSNVLLIGPTGTGKTLMAHTLAAMLDVPFAITDATTLTEAGYVGEDVENILLTLIQNADGDIGWAERGIIYVDEIDKIGRKTENVSITRDVSGEGVQQALLKILEGTRARVAPQGGRKHPQQQYMEIDTSHILFICGGAFVGLDGIVNRRIGKRTLGFLDAEAPWAAGALNGAGLPVEPEDLVGYGLIPELIGRLPVVTCLSDLTEADLVRILTEPRNSMVKQYRKLLDMEGIGLSFTGAALRALARQAKGRGMGARGLRAILEDLMLDVMFEAPGLGKRGTIRITKQMVEKPILGREAVARAVKIA
ncbi:MAG: ATP-dependent Clp protease ATP-binding subunit ClpX [Lentisphaerae bacterium]|nr:ATP-dependent Clp protease ATP-binding subunit ClpX [Lentisphaerota bacterium]